jgi:4-hydroxy-tetrahydrodipicolinate synthase
MWRTEEHSLGARAVSRQLMRRRLVPWGMWLPMVTPMRSGETDLPANVGCCQRNGQSGVCGLSVGWPRMARVRPGAEHNLALLLDWSA